MLKRHNFLHISLMHHFYYLWDILVGMIPVRITTEYLRNKQCVC